MGKRPTASSMAGREFAFKFLYQWIVQSSQPLPIEFEEVKTELDEFEEHQNNNPDNEEQSGAMDISSRKMALDICQFYRDYQIELKALVETYNKSKSLDTMTGLFAIMGCIEILHMDTPQKVVINEYVQLSKKYGAPGAYGVVNAILDKVSKK